VRACGAALLALAAGAQACGSGGAARVAADDAGAGGALDASADDDAPAAADAAPDLPVYPPPFTITAFDHARIGSPGGSWPNVGKMYADVDWMQGPFASVALIVDLESACFPFSKWTTDPPPAGQSWPADCDAFDRNFDWFVDDAGAAVPFEVIHAITPFGGPEHLEVDITDLANALPGAHRLRVDLQSFADSAGQSTGSDGGWTVSARVEVTPGAAPRDVLAAIPLYVGQFMAGDPMPQATWQVPPGTTAARLEYRTSGHGQGPPDDRCIGPSEEFCDRRHQLFVDGATVEDIEPYRTDCRSVCTLAPNGPAGNYCMENPCGDINSVLAPRANWCPGSMTPPYAWDDIPALTAAGPHTFSFQVSSIGMGGFWLASATYYAFGD
jgi:hypothetical protein